MNEIFLPIWYHALVWISYQLFMAFSWPILPVSINIILCSIFYHKTVHGLWWLLKRDLSCFHLKRCRFSIHLNPLVRRAANRSLLVTNSIWSGLLLLSARALLSDSFHFEGQIDLHLTQLSFHSALRTWERLVSFISSRIEVQISVAHFASKNYSTLPIYLYHNACNPL